MNLHRPNNKKPKESLWLMSWADMSMILMCFFVLIISTMTPSKPKFETIQDGMAKDHNVNDSGSIKNIAKKVERLIEKEKLENDAEVVTSSDGLHIEFKSALVFDSGSAALNPKSKEVVYKVLRAIAKIGRNYHLNIEGHTDDVPIISSPLFASNWELSAARGFAMMRSLTDLGLDQSRISVTAFSSTKPKIPYQDLTGKELNAARAANRRVVLFIH